MPDCPNDEIRLMQQIYRRYKVAPLYECEGNDSLLAFRETEFDANVDAYYPLTQVIGAICDYFCSISDHDEYNYSIGINAINAQFEASERSSWYEAALEVWLDILAKKKTALHDKVIKNFLENNSDDIEILD